jgi:hypothetical protein
MRHQNKICARVVHELNRHAVHLLGAGSETDPRSCSKKRLSNFLGHDAPQRIFSDIDVNGDGKLSYKEFAAGLGKQRLYLEHDEFMMVMRLMDTTTGGSISLDELRAFMGHNWEDHSATFGTSNRRMLGYLKEGAPSPTKKQAAARMMESKHGEAKGPPGKNKVAPMPDNAPRSQEPPQELPAADPAGAGAGAAVRSDPGWNPRGPPAPSYAATTSSN